MPGRHRRRGPERYDKAQHYGVPDESIKEPLRKSERRVILTFVIKVNLPQTEKVEVVDQKRAYEHDRPAHEEEDPYRVARDRITDVPHDAGHRPPLPKHQAKCEAGQQNIRASLDRFG